MSRDSALPILAPDLGLIGAAPAYLIPDRGWASVKNGRFRRGKAEKVPGYSLLSTLDGPVMGLFDFTTTSGFEAWIAVTRAKVWKKEPLDVGFVDITGTALTGTTEDWVDFTIFKNLLIFTNGRDAIQKWDGVTATVQALGGSPPKAKRITTFQNHVMLAWIDPAAAIPAPQKIQWSDLGLAETWAGGEAGALSIVDEPSGVWEIMPLRDSLIAYKDEAIYVLEYTGFPFTMSARRLATGTGIFGPRMVVDVRDAHYYVGTDKQIYKLTMSGPEPVGQAVVISMFDELNHQYRQRSFGFLNDLDQEVHFILPGTGSEFPTVDYILNYPEEKWGRRIFPTVTAASAKGVKQLQDISWNSVTTSWDSQTLTWDGSRSAKGANITLHGDLGGKVYQHLATDLDAAGAIIELDLYTKVYDLGDPTRHKRVHRLHVFYEQQASTTLSVYVLATESPTGVATSYGPYTIVLDGNGDAWIDLDITARFFQIRFRNNSLSQPVSISGYVLNYIMREVS